MTGYGHSLEKIVAKTCHLKQVLKADLQFGDLLILTTKNSIYHIWVIDTNIYLVSGGWFDRKGLSPVKISIAGCSWGGSIIKVDVLAICGMRLEFSNHIITTTIKKVQIIHGSTKN